MGGTQISVWPFLDHEFIDTKQDCMLRFQGIMLELSVFGAKGLQSSLAGLPRVGRVELGMTMRMRRALKNHFRRPHINSSPWLSLPEFKGRKMSETSLKRDILELHL